MSRNIIASIRKNNQLHGSLLLTAVEIAHRADEYSGIATVSYSYIAGKCHQSVRSAIRHVKKLVELGIMRCQRFWRPGKRWLVNRYIFLIPWQKPARLSSSNTAQNSICDRVAEILPSQENKEEEPMPGEKWGGMQQLKDGKKFILECLTDGSSPCHFRGSL